MKKYKEVYDTIIRQNILDRGLPFFCLTCMDGWVVWFGPTVSSSDNELKVNIYFYLPYALEKYICIEKNHQSALVLVHNTQNKLQLSTKSRPIVCFYIHLTR